MLKNSSNEVKAQNDASYIISLTETRSGQLRMRFPTDPETTRSLELLTLEPLPWRYRFHRWWKRQLDRRK